MGFCIIVKMKYRNSVVYGTRDQIGQKLRMSGSTAISYFRKLENLGLAKKEGAGYRIVSFTKCISTIFEEELKHDDKGKAKIKNVKLPKRKFYTLREASKDVELYLFQTLIKQQSHCLYSIDKIRDCLKEGKKSSSAPQSWKTAARKLGISLGQYYEMQRKRLLYHDTYGSKETITSCTHYSKRMKVSTATASRRFREYRNAGFVDTKINYEFVQTNSDLESIMIGRHSAPYPNCFFLVCTGGVLFIKGTSISFNEKKIEKHFYLNNFFSISINNKITGAG